MAEIQNYLKPLVEKVDKQGGILRSLYANGSGGPPGYLEMARAEDKEESKRLFGKIDRIVDRLNNFDNRLDAVDAFITDHNSREKQREQDRLQDAALLAAQVRESDRKFKRFIALWSLGLAIFMALIALYDHKDAIIHSLLLPPVPAMHSQLGKHDAGLPSDYVQPR